MPLFIKSSLSAQFRNPGSISNSVTLFKILPASDFNNTDTIISLSKAFLEDEGINYQSQTNKFQEDGLINIELLYSEFEYQDGYLSVDKNTTFLQPADDGSNDYIDTYVKVGQDLYKDALQSPPEKNEANYSISARIYNGIYLNRYYYNLANKKCFKQYKIDSDLPNDDSIYVNYSAAKIVSFDIVPDDGNPAYIKNVVFISDSHLEYQEDLSSQFYQTGGQYYNDSDLNPLYLSILESFFPFIVLKRSSAIHGPVHSSLNSTGNPIEFNRDNYVEIDPFDFVEPIAPVISCRISEDGSRDGYAIVTYTDNTEYFYDAQICGENVQTRFITIKSIDESSLDLYKNFTTISTYLVDIYAYQFRYIAYKYLQNNQDTYYQFKDNGSVASETVKYSSEAIDFTKWASLKEDSDSGVTAINFSFVVYRTSNTEAERLVYELLIPVKIHIPEVISSEIFGTDLIISTNYATNIIYYFGTDKSSAQTIAVTDTADGTEQKTSISISGKTGSITIKAYNYFYTLDIATKQFYISEAFTTQIEKTIIIPSLSLQIKTGSPLTAQNIYDIALESSSTTLSFTDFAQNFPSSYYVLADYSSSTDFSFIFTFTLNASDTSLDLVIGDFSTRLQSASPVIISRSNLFNAAGEDGYVNVTLVLNESVHFKFPIQFKNTSSNAPQVISISTPVLNLDGSGGASISFNINHKYSKKIRYYVKNNNGTVLLDKILDQKSYDELQPYFSAGSTATEEIETEIFRMGDNANSISVLVTCYNLNSSGNEISISSSSASVSTIKRLNKNTPAIFKFYSDSGKTTVATKMVKGQDYYVFLQLKDLAGDEIQIANYKDYIDESSVEVTPIESQDGNIDLDASVSVNDLGDYLYLVNVGSDSKFDDSAFSIKATFNSIIDS